MAELKDIVCTLAERPKTYSKRGMDYINGEWILKPVAYCTGAVRRHVSKLLKGRGRYYV